MEDSSKVILDRRLRDNMVRSKEDLWDRLGGCLVDSIVLRYVFATTICGIVGLTF